MTFNPQQYGLSASLDPENLILARKAYEALVESMKDETKSQDKPQVTLSEEDQLQAVEVNREIREKTFATLDTSPQLVEALLQTFKTLVTDLREFRDWYVNSLKRSGKLVVEVEPDDRKQEAESLKNFIEAMFSAMRPMMESGMVATPDNFSESFPTKKLDSGEVKPDLSRLPSGPRSSSEGRAGKSSHMAFLFLPYGSEDVVEIPAGTFLDEVAVRYCSNPQVRVSRSDIWDKLPRKIKENGEPGNLDVSTDPNDPTVIEVATGLLEVWIPAEKK